MNLPKGFFTLPEEEFKEKHAKYFRLIKQLDRESGKNTPEYKQAYHRWFILREVGVQRGLWLFIPTVKELKEIEANL